MTFRSITIDTTGKVSKLCKIAMHFNSDKCPYSQNTTSGHRHPYTPIYDDLFSSLRDEEINVAEIGIEKMTPSISGDVTFHLQKSMDMSITMIIFRMQKIKISSMFSM